MGDKAREVFEAARKIFCDGIYVKSNAHRCGWDFLSFEYVDEDEIEEHVFDVTDFNDNYDYHELQGMTLAEILEQVGEKGWCFEVSGVDELE